MFPYVAAENGRCPVNERIFTIRRLAHDQLAVLDGDPGPTGTELRHARLREILFHFCNSAEVAVDLGLEFGRDFVAAAIWLHPLPEMQMVVVLAGIVEEAGVLAERPLHHFFK